MNDTHLLLHRNTGLIILVKDMLGYLGGVFIYRNSVSLDPGFLLNPVDFRAS